MKVSNYCQDWHPGGGARTIVTERDGVRTERYVPRYAPWPSNREMRAMLDALYARTVTPKPTMTLAEWDARRAAFRALERMK